VKTNSLQNLLVTGGAGYVGAELVPQLIRKGYRVKVLDLFLYGEDIFENRDLDYSQLELIKGDIRDQQLLKKSLVDVDAVIHLACISNDPSFDLNPNLGKSINLDAFRPLVEISKSAGVKRFIYASSSSVYGVKDEPNVTEEMKLDPLTDYSKFKAECEKILAEYESESFTTVTVRPSTVMGYSHRQRLDVVVNILTNHAFHNRLIKVFGGQQLRPNIHIDDMVELYLLLLEAPKDKIAGKIYNGGWENYKVEDIASIVKKVIGDDVKVEFVPTDDNRSYHVSSEKIKKELGFVAQKSIEDAVKDLQRAFKEGRLKNSFDEKKYYNIKTMLDVELK